MERKKETKNFGGNVAKSRGEPWEWAGCLIDKLRRVGLGTSCHWPGFCLAGSSLHIHTQSAAQMPLGVLEEGGCRHLASAQASHFAFPALRGAAKGMQGGGRGI